MEAFALPGGTTIGDPTGSVTLPPLVHKRQLLSPNGSPVKRRKVSEPVSSPGSPMSTSSVGSTTPSSKSARPNMTASSSITLDMLRPHFEEPLAKVAASFGICVTLLKKICRRHGIARWPHRQITGLRKSIASMEHAIGYFDGDRRESYAEQLLKQKNKLAALLEDPTTNNPLLAAEEDRRGENAKRQPKVASVHVANEVPPASATRASSPTGPLLAESPYYGATSAPVPSHTSPLWFPIANQVESSYTQRYHQLCPPQAPCPDVYSATSYYVPGAVPATDNSSSSAIYLPPLRREPRAMLPPISSLVASGNHYNNSNNLSSSMLAPSW